MTNKRNYHVWTAEDFELLRREYNGNGLVTQRLAEQIGVSIHSVSAHASELKLTDTTARLTKRERKNIISLIQQGKRPVEIARLSGRSLATIDRLARNMAAPSIDDPDMYELEDVSYILGVPVWRVRRWIETNTLKATPVCRSYQIKKADLKVFICRYTSELTDWKPDASSLVEVLAGVGRTW